MSKEKKKVENVAEKSEEAVDRGIKKGATS
jgi:hypothetical protein